MGTFSWCGVDGIWFSLAARDVIVDFSDAQPPVCRMHCHFLV